MKYYKFISVLAILSLSLGGVGSAGATTTSRSNPNKVIAKNSSAQASLTKLPNGMVQAITKNTGFFLMANINVSFNFNPTTKALDPGSVSASIANGMIVGNWKQQGITDFYTSGNDIYFSIHTTAEFSIPGIAFTVICPYVINVDYNTANNTAYFDNIDEGPFKG
jgi:hypothetical protein